MTQTTDSTQQERVEQLLHKLGKAYLERRQFAEAYEKLKQLVEMAPDNVEYAMDASVAAVGLSKISDDAIALYKKAVSGNLEANALKMGLATLFVQKNVTRPFAIQMCEEAAKLNSPNAQKVRLFLKEHYEHVGDDAQAGRMEHDVVFNTKNKKVIRNYLEELWWNGRFPEAHQALDDAGRENGLTTFIDRHSLLTTAYEHFAQNKFLTNRETVDKAIVALENLDIRESLDVLREYLLLRACVPDKIVQANLQKAEIEEYEFILGHVSLEEVFQAIRNGGVRINSDSPHMAEFSLREEILNILEKCSEKEGGESSSVEEWKSILFLKIRLQRGGQIPEKLIQLVSSSISQIKQTLVRQSGTGFLCLGSEPNAVISSVIGLLKHLEKYNAAVPDSGRVFVAGALHLLPKNASDDRAFLNELVKAAHLLKFAENATDDQYRGAGAILLNTAEKNGIAGEKSSITLLPKPAAMLMPGHQSAWSEVIWYNPLSHVQQGQSYQIGRFELGKCLLQNENYATYLAHDTQLDRPVIIKTLTPEHAVKYLENDVEREKLFDKLREIGRLNHPNIANLYDMGQQDNLIFYVREYVEGKPVTEAEFDEEQKEATVLATTQALVRALLYAQREGLMHLNLKPGNVWVSQANQVKIVDFFLPAFSAQSDGSGVLYPAQWRYRAPELFEESAADLRSDVYSLGALLYEIIAGKHPYSTVGSIKAPKDLKRARIQSLRKQKHDFIDAWHALVMKALQSAPNARFGNFTEFDLELRKIQMEIMQKSLK